MASSATDATMLPEQTLAGQVIDGRYRVDGVLGEGGMGLVYKATHITLNKPLAIKVLRADVSRDEEIIQRFKQEAQSASAIGNHHIISISDFGTLPDKSTYFVMEYLNGYDLTDVIENAGKVSAERSVHVARQLCNALGAAHDSGIVHRDLKPDNIYLIEVGSDPDFVKVLDFGIAKVGGSSSKLTRAGQVFGTPHYMSPEQCSGGDVDHRTDIYAVGVILFEMLAGEVPFDADNLMGILSKHLYEDPPHLSELVPGIPEALERIVGKAMAKDRDTRYQTMHELAEDLDSLAMGRPVTAQFPVTESKSKSGGALKWVAIAGVLAVLGIGGAAVALIGSGDEEAKAKTPPVTEPKEKVEPKNEDPPPIAAPVKGVEKVSLISVPAGAEIWSGKQFIGNTPLDIPKPKKGEKLELELHADGYEVKQFAISSLTTASKLSLNMKKAARKTTVRRVKAEDKKTPTEKKPPRRKKRASEVIDPWG